MMIFKKYVNDSFNIMLTAIFLIIMFSQQISIVKAGEMNRHEELSLDQTPYNDGRLYEMWTMSGSTTVSEDFLRLTPELQSQHGSLWTHSSISASTLGEEWEVTIKFKVHGTGVDFFGDGFAFWYTSEANEYGPVFGSRDYWTGLGVFFDTFDNGNRDRQNHPYISVMTNDGTLSYVHGDGGLQHGIPACHSLFRSHSDGPNSQQLSTVRIHYSKPKLIVDVNLHNSDTWTRCVDVNGVYLPAGGYYFGLTASTGDLTDKHDIFSLTFRSERAPKSGEDSTHAVDPDAPTDDEMEGINNIVKETGIVKALKVQGDEHQERITDIKYHLENQVKGLNAHLSSMIGKLEAQEEEMTEQLKRLEELTGHHLSHVQKEHELGKQSWRMPFLILIILMIIFVAYSYRKCQQIQETKIM